MSVLTDYHDRDALGLAELVRTGRVSSRDLLQEARSQPVGCEPHAQCSRLPNGSMADNLANQADRHQPFCGVPFLAKDLMLPFAGYPLSNGSFAMKSFIPCANSYMANRFAKVGLVTFGKTNTSELGTSSLTAPIAFGETRNPCDLSRKARGSSGGSSAAVAARVDWRGTYAPTNFWITSLKNLCTKHHTPKLPT